MTFRQFHIVETRQGADDRHAERLNGVARKTPVPRAADTIHNHPGDGDARIV